MIRKPFLLIAVFLIACSRQLLEEITDEKGVTMRLVPPGEFKMGTEVGQQEAGPVHTVYLDAFYIDKYEATNSSYKDCVDSDGCDPPKSLEYYDDPSYSDHPVVNVDWYMAAAYCAWRGGNLPTEAQWEKAAHGAEERIYPWGNEITCNEATYFDNSIPQQCTGTKVRVGSFPDGVSPYGVYEMAGNVSEWVADWYDGDGIYADRYYANSPYSNPPGPSRGDRKVYRGGSWINIPFDLSSTTRNWSDPSVFHYSLGLRCAKDANP